MYNDLRNNEESFIRRQRWNVLVHFFITEVLEPSIVAPLHHVT